MLASQFAARDVLVVAGAVIAVVAFLLSVLFVRDTAAHVALEQARHHAGADGAPPSLRSAFARATYREPALRSCSQAGLVNNLNDGLAWGLVPLFLAAHGAGVASIGLVAAVYPAVWSVTQIATGHWSDTVGRKPLIVAGMLVQATALGALALSGGSVAIATATAVLLGLGTALVYPTLIAAMSDAVTPVARAPIVGVYRFWRDMNYVLGALIAGGVADALGYPSAIAVVAGLTAASGLWVLREAVAELQAFRLHFSLARQLAERRRAQRLTQKQLSERSGIDQAEISRIERGQANPTTATLGAITNALDVEVRIVPAGERGARA